MIVPTIYFAREFSQLVLQIFYSHQELRYENSRTTILNGPTAHLLEVFEKKTKIL